MKKILIVALSIFAMNAFADEHAPAAPAAEGTEAKAEVKTEKKAKKKKTKKGEAKKEEAKEEAKEEVKHEEHK